MFKGPKLSKLYAYLFITALVSIVTTLCASLFVSGLFKDLVTLVGIVAMVVEVILVFFLRKYNDHFKKGFVLIVVAFVLSAIAYNRTVISGLTISASMSVIENDLGFFILPLLLPLTMAIVAAIIELVAAYYMFSGHNIILVDIDNSLAIKWKKLFTWRMIGTIAKAISMPIIFLSVGLGLVLTILVSIALIVFQCLEVYYLYKTYEALDIRDKKENVDLVIDVRCDNQ